MNNTSYIFTDKNIKQIVKEINNHKNLLLFLDYDGTLAPFHDDPSRAVPLPGILNIIKDLKKHENISVTIISGRNINDLNKMIDLPGLNYAGNHGLEIRFNNGSNFNWLTENNSFNNHKYSTIKETTREKISQKKGCCFEDKGAGFCLHLSQNKEPKIKNYLKQEIENTCLEIISGRNIIEVRPKGWNKGKAVDFIIEKINQQLNTKDYVPLYIGDDSTDEDAFQSLDNGVTIYVENEDDLKTNANYYLNNPRDVYKFLKIIRNRLF